MLNVFFTIDVETWPWGETFAESFTRCIHGAGPRREYGLPYQLEMLSNHGLTGVALVEAMFALHAGHGYLKEVADLVAASGHDLQLHIHPEWLETIPEPVVPPKGKFMGNYTEDEQSILVRRGLELFADCGVTGVNAFRAGNFGADRATLRALARNGIAFDTSYNRCYLDTACKITSPHYLFQPRKLERVFEIPIAYLEDWPGHYRHAQLRACSFAELRHALLQTYESGAYSFVIVSHSFELLTRHARKPDWVMIRRFESLCRFLADNQDKFRTRGFRDLDALKIPLSGIETAPKSSPLMTMMRFSEQTSRRVFSR